MRCFVWLLLIPGLFNILVSQEMQSFRDCQECHTAIVQEWQSSRHAASTAEANPFYAAMLQWANKSSDGQAEEKCNKCHSPVSMIATTEETVNNMVHEGVSCDVCHATQPSGNWLKLGEENVKYGPYQDPISVTHESRYSRFLVSNKQCLICHANLETAHGLGFCSTDKEYKQSSFFKSGVTCQDCHMPAVKSRATELGKIRNIHSHKFYGGYNTEILHNSVSLSISAEGDSTFLAVQVTIRNKTAGHALPTGSPMRSVYLKLRALDENGNIVWQNFLANPVKEDPQAVFMRLLENEAGKAPVPPWEAVTVRFDQRLKPDETRTLDYLLSDTPAKKIIAELYYRLAPPALVKKLNLESRVYGTPLLIASESISLK